MNPIGLRKLVLATTVISKKTSGFFPPLLWAAILLLVTCRLSAQWVSVGPAPDIMGGTGGIISPEGPNPVNGAIEVIVPGATDANLMYVASVNGGVWRTTNAKAASPNWVPLTDQALPSLSLASLAVSPLDANVIFAGAGRVSSLGHDGGRQFGIGRSTDGGATWTVVGTNLAEATVRDIVPTRVMENGMQVVLAGTTTVGAGTGPTGIFRSTDGGVTYAAVTNGIPAEPITDLTGDPGSDTRFYAAANGTIYRSDDTGASWMVATGNGFTVVPGARVLFSVHNSPGNNVVYAAVINPRMPGPPATGGDFANVYRSPNQGATWTALGVPNPPILRSQGSIHGAIVADRTDSNSVWLSGDAADDTLGAISRFTGGAWESVVGAGANGTTPHADSRAMIFDADGNIIHCNDGGIVKLNDPNLATRRWSSLNGDIRVMESHSATYDSVGKNFMCGLQDNGSGFQQTPGNVVWVESFGGDGGIVGVDIDQTAHQGTSLRYYCVQNFGDFQRRAYDANGMATAAGMPAGLMIASGPGMGMTLAQFDMNIQFFQPYVLNAITPSRILIGTTNIYESMDMGDMLSNLGGAGAQVGDGNGTSPITYGSRLNGTAVPDVFYVGAGNRIVHRVAVGSNLTMLTYPGSTVRAVVMDRQNYQRVFVLDDMNRIFGSVDQGANWTDLTGNLGMLSTSIRTIEIVNTDPGFQGAILYAGGEGGVWQLPNPTAAGTWTATSTGLPKVLVYALGYNYTDNVLTAGTLGRGVWRLGGATTPGNAANISTRLPIGTGDNILITGFIVTGPAGSTKRVIVRGIGPSTGIPGALADPTIELHDGTGVLIASNDNWRTTVIGGIITADQQAEIQASGVAPANDAESAIIGTLAPGNYTAQVRGANNTTGIGLSEVYDLSLASAAKLANVSTRGLVQTGDNLMIGGFIIVTNPVRVVVRGIGPSLTAVGVPNALADPTLELRGGNGALILANDNWRDTQAAEIMATGLQPTNDLESAIVMTLQPGNYTGLVRGKNDGTGVGLVEVYALPTLP
jgi:hypothetical protein